MLQRQLIWFSVKIQAIIRIEDVKDSGSCKLKGDVEEKCWPQQIKLDVSTLLFRASKFPSLAYFSFTTDHIYFINTFNAHFFVWKVNLRVPELIFVVHLNVLIISFKFIGLKLLVLNCLDSCWLIFYIYAKMCLLLWIVETCCRLNSLL